MARCVFCEVAAGKSAAHVVFEDENFFGFLDHRPVFAGHTLVVPRLHCETLLELEPEKVGPLFTRVTTVARAVEAGLGAQGTFVAINNKVSQSVPHLHVHVVPRRFGDGLRGFFWPRLPYRDDAEAAETAARIRSALGTAS